MTPTPPILPYDLWPPSWNGRRHPEASDDFAAWAALVIGMSTRNAVEDLHAAGAFSDRQAPAFNRGIRDRAYEVLLALQALAETGYDDRLIEFLDDHAARNGQTDGETIDPLAAMCGAIRGAVRDFAEAEHVPKATADKLETAAVAGTTEAFKALRSLDKPASAEAVSYLARLIPSYWELPEVAPERRTLFGLFSED
jgi:hypothetical protein